MAITIEDGTGVADAVSYVTAAEARTYASARGVTLSAVDAEVEALLVKAGDYLLSVESRFKGTRTTSVQRLPFPRSGVYLHGDYYLGENTIPVALKEAQIQLAIDAQTVDLQPTQDGLSVTREKIGPIETEYSTASGSTSPSFRKALDLLSPLFKDGGRMTLQRA